MTHRTCTSAILLACAVGMAAAEPTFPLPPGLCHDLKADYGAVGDGVADDTAALTAAVSSSEVVNIPPGTYRCTGPVLSTTSNNAGAVLWGHSRDLAQGDESRRRRIDRGLGQFLQVGYR